MRGTCWSLVLLAVFALVPAQNATAKLQNVCVNGTCFMPSEERMAEAAFIPCGNGEMQFPVIRLATSEQTYWSKRTACVTLESVIIPPMPQSERYGDLARVFLSFYLGVPGWTEQNVGRIDLTVAVDGYRAFQCELTKPGWHPWLVDAAPWAGKEVSVAFTVGWLKGEPCETLIALPRTVACHGPYYLGVGGISSGPGPHGMPAAMGGISGGGMDDAAKGKDALALFRLDAVEPGTVRLTSAGNGYEAGLIKGIYWLPLALDSTKPDINIQTLSGLVERGPMDIVPDFLAGDDARLRQLTRNSPP